MSQVLLIQTAEEETQKQNSGRITKNDQFTEIYQQIFNFSR